MLRSRRTAAASIALVGAALLLAGCSTASPEPTASADPCETVRVEVRDISNGAQNKLAAMSDPAADAEYVGTLIERVDALKADAGDNEKLTTSLDGLESALTDAQTAIAAAPTGEDAELPDTTEQATAIIDAAAEVNTACAAK